MHKFKVFLFSWGLEEGICLNNLTEAMAMGCASGQGEMTLPQVPLADGYSLFKLVAEDARGWQAERGRTRELGQKQARVKPRTDRELGQ